MRLLDKAVEDMKKNGVRWYDMGGIDGGGDSRHPWAGMTRFKQGFGGGMRKYAGTYDLIFKMPSYTVYRLLRTARKGR